MWGSKEANTPKLIGQRVRVRVTMLSFNGVQEEIPSETSALFKSGQWHFHLDNTLVHNSILVTDYLTKMGLKKTVPHRPYSPDLAPCDFWLFPKLRGCRYETIEEMKEAVTKVIDIPTQEDFDGALPEVVGTVQQVHFSRRRLLRRGLEFHVCTINKSAHTKKVWKLIVCSSYSDFIKYSLNKVDLIIQINVKRKKYYGINQCCEKELWKSLI